MLLTSTFSTLSLAFLASVALGSPHDDRSTSHKNPIALTKLFTATITVGTVLQPIVIPGGVRVVELYTNGTVVGPAFNGTILGGVGTPRVYNGDTLTLPSVTLYGYTDDGAPFLVQEDGNGSPASTFSRIQLEIGGKYANYSNDFMLGSIFLSADRKTITADGYLPSLKT